ncbi:McrB family protein [Winogradskyella wichelsiae]|uniref:McrB family protein n=1 Tax=Winogradskyella wichelsiae TaxID=2697007 RepID=UPI003EF61166
MIENINKQFNLQPLYLLLKLQVEKDTSTSVFNNIEQELQDLRNSQRGTITQQLYRTAFDWGSESKDKGIDIYRKINDGDEAAYRQLQVSKKISYSQLEKVSLDELIKKISKNKNQVNSERIEQTDIYESKSKKPKGNNSAINYPLNTILYGPPGTGKTYNTILRAAQIIENRAIDSYDEALDIFKTNLHSRIEFITFHQNYSYEDFIQGLRPETKEENEQLKFKKSDGIFKIIADRALSNIKESEKDPEELSQVNAFSEALEILKDKILESDEPIKINETAYFTAVEDDAFRYSGDNWTLNDKGFNGFRMKYSDLVRFFEEGVKERREIKNLENISGLAKQHATYFIKAFELVKSLMPKSINKTLKTDKKNYVIIIDEINRANISRVFGELITLIEPDKRSHGAIPLEARLPSGDLFIVPSNLFIIGTMNTADKSIALLDIALRRRFEFESMYPKYEIENQEIYDVEILEKINKQIIKSKGHDFQIGQAYFMGDNKDLIQRMNKKVIPLLLEYYMNDEKEVKGILNSAGLIIEENSWPLRITRTND